LFNFIINIICDPDNAGAHTGKDKVIGFIDFVIALKCICRSPDDELDKYIFNMFHFNENKIISKDEITMILYNLPDLGFNNSQNMNMPDKFHMYIKELVVSSVEKENNRIHSLIKKQMSDLS